MKHRFVILAVIAGVVGVAVNCASPPVTAPCDPKQGFIMCSGLCVMPNSDTENCGGCGRVCAPGEACVHGTCATQCPKDNLVCARDGGASCVNAMTDNQNCGACGVSCNGAQICYRGQCSSTCGDDNTGQTLCTPEAGPPYCANLATDRNNCGACGSACNAAQACVNGKCADQCDTNQTMCDNGNGPFCTDTSTDNANCGGCGVACNVGALEVCSASQCSSQCDAYQTLCAPDGGSPFCASTQTDNNNCGACGNVCPSSQPYCSSGSCSATAPQGVVYLTSTNTKQPVSFVACGTGDQTSCTSAAAIAACANIGKNLAVYENYYGTPGVTTISTQNYEFYAYYTVGYFINYDPSIAGQCLVAVNAVSGYYCGDYGWNGAVETIPSATGTQFGYVEPFDQGYQSSFTNFVDSYMYCTTSYAAYNSSCSTYYVACF